MPSQREYRPLPPEIDRLEAFLCLAANLDPETLHTPTRERDYVDVRHAIWYVAREYMGYSYPALARLYGRDHTTIVHGVMRMAQNPERERIVKALEERQPDLLKRKPGTNKGVGIGGWDL